MGINTKFRALDVKVIEIRLRIPSFDPLSHTIPYYTIWDGGKQPGPPCCMLKVKQKSIGDSIDPRDKTRERECEGPRCMTIKWNVKRSFPVSFSS